MMCNSYEIQHHNSELFIKGSTIPPRHV